MTSGASDIIGERVREIRTSRGWTAKDLAARCAKVGAPQISRAVIANIETGRRNEDGSRRREVSVDEMLALAFALEVPPFLLCIPLDRADALRVTGTVEMDPFQSAVWITGEPDATVKVPGLEDFRTTADLARWLAEWRRRAAPIGVLREAARSMAMFSGIIHSPGLDVPETAALLAQRTARWIDQLAALGIALPSVPPLMAALIRDGNMLEIAHPDELTEADVS